MHNVPGRPIISNCGFYTANISSFLDYHLQPMAQKMNSLIKDTNHFLRKIKSLGQLPEGPILCTIDAVGLYTNIPHEKGLASHRSFLDARAEKKLTPETLLELAEILKNTVFQFNESPLIQLRRTAIDTKFALPYAIMFLADLEKKISEIVRIMKILINAAAT